MRTGANGVLELFEDDKHGTHANVGLYSLKEAGDRAYFTFWQDQARIKRCIDAKVADRVKERLER